MRPLCSISIDLDPIECYYRIHALGCAPAELDDLILRSCVPRFAALFDSRGTQATFFVVGRELEGDYAPAASRVLADLVGAGHELGNHSYNHYYDLARLDAVTVCEEIERAHALIGRVAGTPVVGFRAPGYDVSASMLDTIMRLGYSYDSSIFPAPGYYAAKAAVMGAMALARRDSGAVLTNPRALLAPPDPYRPAVGAPWRRGQATVVELPIAVTPVTRIPAIGTALLLAPSLVRRGVLRAMRRRPFFNFELHGIDLADADVDGIPGRLVARQPDLRVSLAQKRQVLAELLDEIHEHFEVVPLRDVANIVQREGLVAGD